MKHTVWSLLLLLVGQSLLVMALYSPSAGPTQLVAKEPMLSLNPDELNEIHIGDERDQETVLLRQGGRWILPELEGLPADEEKVNTLLNGIGNASTGWPVAHIRSSRLGSRVGVQAPAATTTVSARSSCPPSMVTRPGSTRVARAATRSTPSLRHQARSAATTAALCAHPARRFTYPSG